MKNYIFVLALALLPTIAWAQTNKGGLKVFLQNADRDDIRGAVVKVMYGDRLIKGGATDFTGFLYLPNIDAGWYKVIVSYPGWRDYIAHIEILSNSIRELRFDMQPAPLELTVLVENARWLKLRNVQIEVIDADSASAYGYCAKNGVGWVRSPGQGPNTVIVRHPLCKELSFTLDGVSACTRQERVILELNALGKVVKMLHWKRYGFNKLIPPL